MHCFSKFSSSWSLPSSILPRCTILYSCTVVCCTVAVGGGCYQLSGRERDMRPEVFRFPFPHIYKETAWPELKSKSVTISQTQHQYYKTCRQSAQFVCLAPSLTARWHWWGWGQVGCWGPTGGWHCLNCLLSPAQPHQPPVARLWLRPSHRPRQWLAYREQWPAWCLPLTINITPV